MSGSACVEETMSNCWSGSFVFFFFLEIFVFDFPFWLTAACITVLKWYINRTEENLSDLSI